MADKEPITRTTWRPIRKERFVRRRKLTEEMKAYIIEKMKSEQWSQEQIKDQADINGIPMVSHETIYKIIRNDKANGGDLYKNYHAGSNTERVLLGVNR